MKGGPPPPDSSRRCQARKHSGEQCKRWALTGARNCQFHGGRQQVKAGTANLVNMPSYYNKYLMPRLREAVEQQLSAPQHEVVSVFEELAVMRAHAGQAVGLWSKATEKGELIMETGALMRQILQEVCTLVERATRIDQSQGVITVHQLHGFVQQLTRICYEELDLESAQKIERALLDKVRVPTGQPGTDLLPDQDVTEMDKTVATS